MSGKTKADQAIEGQAAIHAARFDEFIASVRHVLMKAHETPLMVVDHLLEADSEYLRRAWDDAEAGEDLGAIAVEAADELAFRPAKGKREWVLASENSVVVEVSAAVKARLTRLTSVGLYGDDEQEVARTLMVRGIECVLHLVPNAVRR